MPKMKLSDIPSNLAQIFKYVLLFTSVIFVLRILDGSSDNETGLLQLTAHIHSKMNLSNLLMEQKFLGIIKMYINQTNIQSTTQYREFRQLLSKSFESSDRKAEKRQDFSHIKNANFAKDFNKTSVDILRSLAALEKEVNHIKDKILKSQYMEELQDPLNFKKYNFYRLIWVTTISNSDGFASEAIDFIIPLCMKYPMFGWVDEVETWQKTSLNHREMSGDQQKLLEQCNERGKELMDMDVLPGIAILQFGPLDYKRIKDLFPHLQKFKYLIGRSMFETNSLPGGWLEPINTLINELWVPTEYHVNVFVEHGVTIPVKAVGEGYNPDIFNPDTVSRARAKLFPTCNEDDYIFLTISKWEDRKGYDHMFEAFRDAFTAEDKVCLAIRAGGLVKLKFDNPNGLRSCKVERLSFEQYPMAYQSANAYISASHGEGWGRTAVEAMAMGLPTIIPVWGGVTGYARDDVLIPILVDELEVAYPVKHDQKYLNGATGHMWGKVLVPRIKDAMLKAYYNQSWAKKVGEKAKSYVLANFTRDVIADKVIMRTNEIFNRKLNVFDIAKNIDPIKEEEKVEEKAEEKAFPEEKVEVKAEEKVEEKVEEKAEEKAEDKAEDKVEGQEEIVEIVKDKMEEIKEKVKRQVADAAEVIIDPQFVHFD